MDTYWYISKENLFSTIITNCSIILKQSAFLVLLTFPSGGLKLSPKNTEGIICCRRQKASTFWRTHNRMHTPKLLYHGVSPLILVCFLLWAISDQTLTLQLHYVGKRETLAKPSFSSPDLLKKKNECKYFLQSSKMKEWLKLANIFFANMCG